ncbi:uncharacterized protein LOC100897708 [Galendromus occidentalis]|uniref:Uncharacterized protein LOC100897708 n=1 Tax=Galendromus occidentalis TaxID=34638 RepID=A0AAJ6W096_9ACAR|nr:uncharacterized protein LOC100897708 [Galendromus occidentalis]
MFAATLIGAITLATGVVSFPHDLQHAATESSNDPFGQYQYLVLLVQDSSPQSTHTSFGESASSIPSSYPYRAPPKNQAPASQWHSFLFGPESLHRGNTQAYSAEDIIGGNGLDFNFGDHQSAAPQLNRPPRPSFPSHLEGIQSNHPQGTDYWNNLQGDHSQCPVINSCPAKYGCYVRQKPGRCAYCKCESRTPNKLHER